MQERRNKEREKWRKWETNSEREREEKRKRDEMRNHYAECRYAKRHYAECRDTVTDLL